MRAGYFFSTMLALAGCAGVAAETVLVPQGSIEVAFNAKVPVEQRPLLLEWITQSARSVAVYFDGFPVRRVRVSVSSRAGGGASGGQASGWDGPRIDVAVGREATRRELLDEDWLLTHEFSHLGFPDVPERHHWIEEGMATYVEPVARVRAGVLTSERMWRELVEGLPQGMPQPGDRGLDFTPTWGRTYWGGALFCVLADVEIRRRTENRRGLEHALRGIVAAGGTIESSWPLRDAIEAGDRATGVPVLRELYERMKDKPESPDLAKLWRDLGVARRGARVEFDDKAPLAEIRRAITAGR